MGLDLIPPAPLPTRKPTPPPNMGATGGMPSVAPSAAGAGFVPPPPGSPTPRPRPGLDAGGPAFGAVPELMGEPTDDDDMLWIAASAGQKAGRDAPDPLSAAILGFVEAKRIVGETRRQRAAEAKDEAREDEEWGWRKEDRAFDKQDRSRKAAREGVEDQREDQEWEWTQRDQAHKGKLLDYDLIDTALSIRKKMETRGGRTPDDEWQLTRSYQTMLDIIDEDFDMSDAEKALRRAEVHEKYREALGLIGAGLPETQEPGDVPPLEEQSSADPAAGRSIVGMSPGAGAAPIGDEFGLPPDAAPPAAPGQPQNPAEAFEQDFSGAGTNDQPFVLTTTDHDAVKRFVTLRMKPGQFIQLGNELYRRP